jgi:uncharacterized protein involved in exopolysaccharide biosynthesis
MVDRAMAPDEIDVLKPKKLVVRASGLALGALLGIVGALVVDRWNRKHVSSSIKA